MKHLLIKIKEHNGEQEYTIPYLMVCKNNENSNKVAQKVAATWYGDDYDSIEGKDGDTTYMFFGGGITTKVYSVQEIPEEHYDILNLYEI